MSAEMNSNAEIKQWLKERGLKQMPLSIFIGLMMIVLGVIGMAPVVLRLCATYHADIPQGFWLSVAFFSIGCVGIGKSTYVFTKTLFEVEKKSDNQ